MVISFSLCINLLLLQNIVKYGSHLSWELVTWCGFDLEGNRRRLCWREVILGGVLGGLSVVFICGGLFLGDWALVATDPTSEIEIKEHFILTKLSYGLSFFQFLNKN